MVSSNLALSAGQTAYDEEIEHVALTESTLAALNCLDQIVESLLQRLEFSPSEKVRDGRALLGAIRQWSNIGRGTAIPECDSTVIQKAVSPFDIAATTEQFEEVFVDKRLKVGFSFGEVD